MPSDLVLITGATGHIGFKVLVIALEAGYSVRAAVRSQSKSSVILNAPSIKALAPGSRLTFTVVPDILAPGAYDEAVKGVKYIIHLASPITNNIPADKFESELIQPAVQGTVGILSSAHKFNKNIKRIVITSSVIAVVPWKHFFEVASSKVYDADNRVGDVPGPYGSEFEAYGASKTLALKASEDFVDQEKPSFDIVNILPTFVIGKNELVTEAKDITNGTNGAAFAQVLGNVTAWTTPGATVFLDDIAGLHVQALDPKIPGHSSFLGSSESPKGTTWGDAIAIVAKHFPKAVAAGVLPNNGSTPSHPVLLDVSSTEKAFGIKFHSYEDQVVSVTKHYLDLVGFKEE